MLKLHVIQAHEGDCLLLEHRTEAEACFVLVDGGARDTWDPYLRRALRKKVRRAGRRLDLLVLSHVDADHVTGLLELFVELRSARDEGRRPLVEIDDLWHNSFELLPEADDIVRELRGWGATVAAVRPGGIAGLDASGRRHLWLCELALDSIRQGHDLAREARLLRVEQNRAFGGGQILASGDREADTRRIGGLDIRVVGPTQANLDDLRRKWRRWLEKQQQRLRRGHTDLAAMTDKSVPNLSSVQLLIEAEGRRLLLTGDGRGDHLLEALAVGSLLDDEGGIDVDVLKLPHHGSNRNATPEFFERVRASTYVVSANGKHDNPDYDTLEWLVDAARTQGRRITLAVTNATPATDRLVRERPPRRNGYRLRVRRKRWGWITVRP